MSNGWSDTIFENLPISLAAAKKAAPAAKPIQWPDPYAPTAPNGTRLPQGQHWTGYHDPEHDGYATEPDAPGSLSFDKKYPADFVRLYNSFLNQYVQNPTIISAERQVGSGPWTSRMDQLDSLKGTMDWIRQNGSPQLRKLPLGAQDYIASSPDFEEWQSQLKPDPYNQGGGGYSPMGNIGEPQTPKAQNPQPDDIRRLFGNQIWGGYVGSQAFGPSGGWGI